MHKAVVSLQLSAGEDGVELLTSRIAGLGLGAGVGREG
jgi:hypothetical protein